MTIQERQMEKIAKSMGIHSENIQSTEVIIKGRGKDIVIKEPNVTRLRVQSLDTFQVTGKVLERTNIDEDDVKFVMEQTNASSEDAKKALEENEGSITKAVLKLKNNKTIA